ncbi:MAG: 50S ribosomal protein L4 [Planctomycetaceae bacterium]|jgi:large subunit ribosomal protein L4|nr:50S ribosomal protein L4 [Planctomycetaceae bacterium]
MATLPVYNMNGEQIETFDFNLDELAKYVNLKLLHEAVVMYQANLRQGSAKSKTRAEVAGSKKKMYRQKGTGNARAGHKRSGVRRGGGHIFAKAPRDFSYRLPRKALQTATRMALLSKIDEQNLILLNELQVPEIKTKKVVELLKNLKVDSSVLLATDDYDANVYKSGRNLPRTTVLPAAEINAYQILKPKKVVMTKKALDSFRKPLREEAVEN